MNGDCNFFPAEFDEHEKCEDELCSESFAAFPHWFEDFWNLDTNFGLSGFPNNSDAKDVREARLAQNAKLIKHTESHYRNDFKQVENSRDLQCFVDNHPLITSSGNLGLDVVDGVGSLDIKGLSGQGLHEDLHTTTEAQHEVERGLLLDVVVRSVRPSSSCLPAKIKRRWP